MDGQITILLFFEYEGSFFMTGYADNSSIVPRREPWANTTSVTIHEVERKEVVSWEWIPLRRNI